MKTRLISVISFLLWLGLADTVDRSKFRTCRQSSFCRRSRSVSRQSGYELDLSSLSVNATAVSAKILNKPDNVEFVLELIGLEDDSFRFRITEANPLVKRFEVPHVLVSEPVQWGVEVRDKSDDGFTLAAKEGSSRAVVQAKPLQIHFYSGGVLVLSANARGLLQFEHTRERRDGDEPDLWRETFSGNVDSKPHGPTAVAMDFTFVDTDDVYGIPEHADKFSLKDTSSTDPYRLYNLDVFEYELWNPMALYAAVPFMIGHNKRRTTGLFWLNAAETWVDVKKSSSGVLGSLSNMMSSTQHRVDTQWISESGIIDTFVFLGPKPKDVSRQYGKITGTTPLPPEFSLAYHQCRWNYNDETDVREVADKFDEFDIPMDVMWLDIEHTDGKKYFTWDKRKFPNPLEMVHNLTAVGRKLVTIVDPHIKKDNSYWVHTDCKDQQLYVKNREGNDYEGWCWPGASYYPDFLNPKARLYFAEQYDFDKYIGTSQDVFTWNDMNEPSVFNGPEVTMPKDMVHIEGFEHRDVHNIYGHLYVMATHAGQLSRSDNKVRPFILTRSGFAGTQRIAAKWTGDNTADWGHLEASVPMCLSLSVAGISFCGADVGGFFGNPNGELFVRWYQAAAFQPFFRSHAHLDSKRREPWLFTVAEKNKIRDAIRLRYSYLPYLYTLFYEGEKTGTPPMRPSWYEFPEDEDTFSLDNQHMLGHALLIHPISKAGETSVHVTFPGEDQLWYDIATHEKINYQGGKNIPVSEDHIPVYQRGGTIIPKKERPRRSSVLMRNDPYTLVIALDKQGEAEGSLYIDDKKTFEYRNGKSILMKFTFLNNGVLTSKQLHADFLTKEWLERVVIIGLAKTPASIAINPTSGGDSARDLKFSVDNSSGTLTIRKPGVNMAEEWEMKLEYVQE